MAEQAATAVYTRVSTRDQAVDRDKLKSILAEAKTPTEAKKLKKQAEQEARKASLVGQERRCRASAESKEWGIYKLYEDAGESGAKDDRPALMEMVTDAKAGKFQHLIFDKLDRFGRNTRDMLNIAHVLKDCGVGIVSVKESFDTSTSSGRLFFTILGALAEKEREDIRERMIDGKNAAAAEGKWTGGTLAYGFDYVDGHFTINEPEAEIVQRVFNAYPRGRTHKQIAEDLNADGLSTRAGGKWFPAQVSRILKNTAYLGEGGYNKIVNGVAVAEAEWTSLTFPRIIEERLWKQVRNRTAKNTRNGHRPKDAVTPYLLSGLVGCECCQGGMTSRTKRRKDHRLHYYTCTRQYHYETDCLRPKMQRADKVDADAWDLLTTALSAPEDILTACEVYAEELGAGNPVDDGQVSSLRRALAARGQERERWETLWTQAKITDAKRDKHFSRLDREMTEIQEHLDRLAEAREQQVNIEQLRGQVFRMAEMMSNGAQEFTLEERKSFVRSLIEKVWLGSGGELRIQCAIEELNISTTDGKTRAQGDSMAWRHSEQSEESQRRCGQMARACPEQSEGMRLHILEAVGPRRDAQSPRAWMISIS